MILDRLEDSKQYCRLHGGFDAAFDLLLSTPFGELKAGRHEVMGDSLFLIIDDIEARGRDASPLEAHRRYIDVQYVIPDPNAKAEEFGWRPVATCTSVTTPYNKEKDIVYFGDKPQLWFTVPAGYFVVFFPGDAHAPLAGNGRVLKAVVKVAVDW